MRVCILTFFALLAPAIIAAQEPAAGSTPAFYPVPELVAGFNLLYQQKFTEARETFSDCRSHNPDKPFVEVALPASHLFEDLSRQGLLTSDFFLNERRF